MDGGTSPGDHSLFRVRLWGTLRVEKWVDGRSEAVKTTDWGGSNYPRLLLKALLCCPGCRGRREALIEMLWPEMESEPATANLNTATTKLRMLLRAARGQESLLVTEDDATLYHLPVQEVLWVDSDAVQEKVEQAERIGRTTREALPLLEEAIALSNRGPFLEGEEGQWAAEKRATRELERYRGRLWLVDNYIQQALFGRAEAILQTLRENDPFDEDVLQRLLTLLPHQGMVHQALRLYETALHLFAEEGLALTEATQAIAQRLQEGGLYKPDPLARKASLQEVRKAYVFPGDSAENHKGALVSPSPLILQEAMLSPHLFLEDETLDRLKHVLLLSARPDPDVITQLHGLLFEQKRRLVSGEHRWQEILAVASSYLRLGTSFLESHAATDQLLSFVAETALLMGDVLFNQKAIDRAMPYYTIAVNAAQQAQAASLQAIVYGRYSLLLIDTQQARQAQPLLQEALRLAMPTASGVICAWLWSVVAEAHAHCAEEVPCLDALDAARTWLDREEREAAYTFVPQFANYVFSHAKLLGYEGASYLHLHQPEQAQKRLTISQQASSHPHHQSLVLTDYALTFVQQQDPQSACTYAEQALSYIEQTCSARALQRLLSVRVGLQRWDNLAVVRDFEEHVRLLSHA